MIHCLTSFTSSFFPYEQGNCHLMTEPLRIYLSLYGKLPLPRGMGFSTYAEFTVASGIYHIPRLQGLGIISHSLPFTYTFPARNNSRQSLLDLLYTLEMTASTRGLAT